MSDIEGKRGNKNENAMVCPVTPLFSKIKYDRNWPQQVATVDPRAYLRKGQGALKKRKRFEVEKQGSEHSDISIPLRLPPLKPKFYDSLTRGLKKQTAAKIKNVYLNDQEFSESQSYAGISQQRNPRNQELLGYQEGRRAVNPNPQPKKPMSEQEVIQAKRQLEMQIQNHKEEKKRLQEKIEMADKKAQELGVIFDKIDKQYKQAVKMKDPSAEILQKQKRECRKALKQWEQRRKNQWNKLEKLNQQILLERQKLSQLRDYLSQLDQQDQQPQEESERQVEKKREKEKKHEKKPAFQHEKRAQITQEELREIGQRSIQEEVQGLCKQRAQLEKQISDLQAESQKVEANKLPGIGKKGVKDLMEEKESQLYELRQRIEELEGKLQEI